ncbi:MAG: hypothetical protein ACC645_20360 [Pirellulales bacterium]
MSAPVRRVNTQAACREAIAAWRVEEQFGFDWPEQAVHVKLDKKTADAIAASGEPIRVVDETGRSVPGQLVSNDNSNRVWYLASLRSKATKTYRFARGEPASHQPLTLAVRGDVAEMANDSFAVRLSWSDDISFSPSKPLDMLAGPIRALRGPDGVWVGKGSWAGNAHCRAFRCRVIEKGPVLLVVQQTYELEPGGELTFEYRVDAATPGVTVALQCDVSMDAVAKWDFFERGGFEPSHAFWRAHFHADYFSGKGIGAALLTGHPRQRQWMNYAIREASQYLRNYHFSSGCGKEASTYQMVSLNYMLLLATAVRHAGGDDLFSIEPMMKSSFDYLASTQTPRDPRTGFSMLPTVGHVTTYGWCQSLQVYFAWAAKATAASDPAFSKRMMAAWKRAGALPISLHDFANGMGWWQPLCLIDRTLPASADPTYSQSRLHEGLGAIFRTAHKGYLLVKMGPSRGHYDADEGSLVWYAFGKPLLVDFGCQYNPSIECAWLHNRISFDRWNNDSGKFFRITGHQLGEHTDYLSGQITVSRLYRWDDWPIRDPDFDHQLAPPPKTIDPVTWRRQVLYIRECEAVVMLDELGGAQATDWNLQVLADEVRVEKRSAHFRGQFGVDLDVYFAEPGDPAIRISSFEHLGFDEPRIGFPWWRSMRWAAPKGTSFGPLGERALTLRTRAASHPKYLTLLVARPTDQPAPDVTLLPDGAGFEWEDHRGRWSVRLVAGRMWNVSASGERIDWSESITTAFISAD